MTKIVDVTGALQEVFNLNENKTYYALLQHHKNGEWLVVDEGSYDKKDVQGQLKYGMHPFMGKSIPRKEMQIISFESTGDKNEDWRTAIIKAMQITAKNP